MNEASQPYQRLVPQIGSVALLVALLVMCILPLVLWQFMNYALAKLHLGAVPAAMIALGIIFGGLINIPVRRYPRSKMQPIARGALFGLEGWRRSVQLSHAETILAVNVGGCVIPTLLALYQVYFVLNHGMLPIVALVIAVAVNVAVCYRFAVPIEGVGIALPAFIPPLAALLIAWLLLAGQDYDGVRAPVAFIAGVMGPLVGADLLNLNKITKISTGMASIGGAGTFDGIVVSSVVAAFLA